MSETLGISRDSLANIENDRNTPTQPVIQLMCDRYNVNEKWLVDGEGAMFRSLAQEEEIENFFRDVLLTEATSDGEKCRKALISALARIPTDKWEEIASVLNKLVEDYGEAKKEE